ncbi:DNA-binding NarL/FixJ family response regulator [Winogradskyella wandonensis]|uniref:DNA-binding NarL/FixJ family response regulator n=1 Tax=Winogradskyella wandonensis TaxID=1442586 RepID=A0A4R1KSS2_9FLAO|nr:response regulator [Winogradskyella wandonensis]TCK68074.1 DNA-binding NarL/FixJ family response regulator [Winogradskyella wandonensis]
MHNKLELLMVDDHHFVLEAYKNYIEQSETNKNYELNFKFANSIDEALELSKRAQKPLDVLFLDIRIPKRAGCEIVSGETLGQVLLQRFPKLKIIVITGHHDELMISNILYNLKPEAILFKGDVDFYAINTALENILKDIPFYSSTILKLIRKKFSSDIILDKTDKQLLYEISKGAKTKDLKEVLPLSVGGIEKRKRLLKELFSPKENNDQSLIDSAAKKGYL